MASNLVLRVNSLFKDFKRRIKKIEFTILKVIIYMEEKKNYLDGDLKLNNTHLP